MNESQPEPSKTRGRQRPFWIKVLAIAILLISLLGFVRMQQAIVRWSFLQTLVDWPLALYLVIGGALWGLAGLPAVFGLWRGKPWAGRATWLVTISYLAAYWLDWIFLVESRASQGNAPFAVCVSAVWLAAVFFILRSRAARRWLNSSQND